MAKTYATWNPADNTGWLSNWNLTWTQDSAVVNKYGKATIWKSSWKWYWEYTTWTSFAIIPWICLLSQAWLDYWKSATGYWYYSLNGWKYNNNAQTFYSTWQSGIIWVKLDMDAGTIELTQNWVSAWVQFSGLSWTFCPVVVSFSIGDNITANFWQSAFSYAVPSGYNSWLYTEANDWNWMMAFFLS